MGEVINLGRVYWSDPDKEDKKALLEDNQKQMEEIEKLKRQLTISRQLNAQEPPRKISPIIPKNKKPRKKPEPRTKAEIKPIDNLETDSFFYKVYVQLNEIRKSVNKRELNLMDYFLEKLGRKEKGYGFFTVSALARKFKTNRTRIRKSLKILADTGAFIIKNKGNQGKVIFYNTPEKRKLIEDLESGKLPFEIVDKPWLNDKNWPVPKKEEVSTDCTHPLGTERSSSWVQNEPAGGTKAVQVNTPESTANSQSTATPKINHSYINSFKIKQSINENELTVKEINLFLSDEQKFEILKINLRKLKMSEKKLKELISVHSLNNVFYCYKDLVTKKEKGVYISNLPGLLITELPEYDCSEEINQELQLMEKEQTRLLLDEKNIKYLEIFKCVEPTKIKITDWQKDLKSFSQDLLFRFNNFEKPLDERMENHFKEFEITTPEKKQFMTAQVEGWIEMENKEFKIIISKLKKLVSGVELNNLLNEAYENNPDNKTKKLIKALILNF
jgi:hypothetical protein